ncbi:hypothetical protein SAY87_021778 [Trapa incisa]|uniref:Uncharacterized protein n=1 Tax=Trapa incisa TaxID=236973 RepID=A0AAN7JU44_9MYRT|nr:hypothetical protein SAY87_021778 [Trapa incisa]
MKKINLILRKCRSLTRQLVASSSYSSLRSKSSSDHCYHLHHYGHDDNGRLPDHQGGGNGAESSHEIIFVGRTRKPYVISSKYLSHPLINALIEKPHDYNKVGDRGDDGATGHGDIRLVRCEVVVFDHLLWLLDNSEDLSSESMEELAALYAF